MAIEIPNALHAAGVFDGSDPPVNDDPIFTSEGVLPFDPATTPADPVGGFTRLGTTDYLVQTVDAIDFREGCALVTCLPTKPGVVCPCATIVPPEDDNSTDGQISVIGDGLTDVAFSLLVLRIKSTTEGTYAP